MRIVFSVLLIGNSCKGGDYQPDQSHVEMVTVQRRLAATQTIEEQEAKCINVDLIALFCLIFQLVSEQQESRPLLSPSIDDFLCETKCDGAARPVTSNTAGTRDTDLPVLPQKNLLLHYTTLHCTILLCYSNSETLKD